MSSKEFLQSAYPEAKFESCVHDSDYGFEIIHMKDVKSNIQLVFTDGCSRYEQNVSGEENADLKQIELYFCLPDYLNLEVEDWPIHWLQRIARVPQKNNTWFGYGDTLPAGSPPEHLTESFLANHFILSKPIHLSDKLENNGDFKFLAVIPLFETEFSYKMRNSHTVLFDRFKKKGITELVDLYRASVCRKRILGMF